MNFADLAAGDAVFVDANTLTYHFEPHRSIGKPIHHEGRIEIAVAS